MLNNYNNLLYELEDIKFKLDLIELEKFYQNEVFNCANFSKKLVNYKLLEKKTIELAEFDIKKNEALYFTFQLDANLQSAQNVYITIYVGKDKIYYGTRALLSGEDEVLIFADYTPSKSEHVKVSVEITPLLGKLITIRNLILIVSGIQIERPEPQYQIIENNDKYLLSIIKNNSLYYRYISKSISENNLQSFTLYKSAKVHCFAYLKSLNILILLRVDINGKLFICDFTNNNETFVEEGVSFVSADYNDDVIIACYIKKGYCYLIEIRNLALNYSKKRINFAICSLNKCLVHFNKFRQKFYLVLSDKYDSNYLIESEEEDYSQNENIIAEYSVSINTYGGTQ